MDSTRGAATCDTSLVLPIPAPDGKKEAAEGASLLPAATVVARRPVVGAELAAVEADTDAGGAGPCDADPLPP